MATRSLIFKILLISILFVIGDLSVFQVLKRGMDTYYGFNRQPEVLLVGHSHTVLGIDAQRLERGLHIPVAKYATAGANVLDRYWMLRHFIGENPTVKMVVYDVEPRLFDSEGLSSASYTLFLPYMDDPAMSVYMKQEASWQEYYSGKLVRTTRFRDQTLNIGLRGLLGKIENKKAGRFRVEDVRKYLEREKERSIRINPETLRFFQKTMSFLAERHIKVVLLFIPVVDLLNEIDPENQKKVVAFFEGVAQNYDNVYFLNYNKDFEHKHELFYDLRHLNKAGNRVVTDRLTADLSALYGNSEAQR